MSVSLELQERCNTGGFEFVHLTATVTIDTPNGQLPTSEDFAGYLDHLLVPFRLRVQKISSNSDSMIFKPAFLESTAHD